MRIFGKRVFASVYSDHHHNNIIYLKENAFLWFTSLFVSHGFLVPLPTSASIYLQ